MRGYAVRPKRFVVPCDLLRRILFRWCLSQGLGVIKPMTLMVMGEYRTPTSRYFPSVMY